MADAAVAIGISVVQCLGPRQVQQHHLELPPGSTVADALRRLGASWPGDVAGQDTVVGVWGRAVQPDHRLRDGDRIELYRALLVDPKVARRERFVRQGARGAGLFSRRRPGGKPGY